MSYTYTEGSGGATPTPLTQFYYGTIIPSTLGATIAPGLSTRAVADSVLDAGRQSSALLRSTAVWAASSIKNATVIAAIRSYSRSAPIAHAAIHVYRVQLTPLHIGPVAVIEELLNRLQPGGRTWLETLIREYWEPTGIWHLREILASSSTVLEEVPAATEGEVYIRRWVQYNQDCERAQLL